MIFFGKRKNQFGLGIDVGTKGIKIVEVSKKKDKFFLENYGEINLDIAGKQFFRYFDKNTLNPSVDNITRAIRAILSEAEIETDKVVFSLPDFATFSITFDLPPMTKKEITNAVAFEARKYIPLPLSEVVLDWQIIDSNTEEGKNNILLMAIPKILVEHYKKIAGNSGLELIALEAEAIALKRALVNPNDSVSCLVEIGFQSTNVIIVENDAVKSTFSFDIAGKDLTLTLAETLNMEIPKAESLKIKNGLSLDNNECATIMASILSLIIEKTKRAIREYQSKENKKIEQLILSGGTAKMIGIVKYFQDMFDDNEFSKIKIKLGNPFENISYPPSIEEKMKKSASVFAIALGEALKKFEK
ncbi:MAG: type IV pilus assembly protein PilM [Candidatus Pacebacteria bacterium]|nr:type IV pilus assembly protein PilM [Candidatus Paceibacterota bacterium]MDD5013287.1 type IV pilus assembly protein PilM [Candidatus Paceibacterota bacterium]MDD5752746.1 type IV pilus assembly protein PilM [Candidatus Paceibacterota bacterium]